MYTEPETLTAEDELLIVKVFEELADAKPIKPPVDKDAEPPVYITLPDRTWTLSIVLAPVTYPASAPLFVSVEPSILTFSNVRFLIVAPLIVENNPWLVEVSPVIV